MRILILNSARKFIGEAAHCLSLAGELRRRGHEVTLGVRRGFALEERASQAQLPLLGLGFSGSFSLTGDLRDLCDLRRFVREWKPDVIHCHRGKDHWLAAALVTLAKGPPLVRTRHVVVPMRTHVFNRWLFSRKTERVIAVSEMAARSFGALLPVIQHKLKVVYSAVDTARFHPAKRSGQWRAARGVGEHEPLVGLIARIQNIKGQRIFLQAAARILARQPKARFLISGAGTPEKFDHLRQQAASLGLDGRVVFEGWQDEIETAVASLDVGVVASLGSEGSSRITLEYMASGVPVVATRVGGIPEILHEGETGLVVEPGSADALAQAVVGLLGSEALAGGLRERALARARGHFCHERWVSETVEIYSRALGQRGETAG